MVRDAYTRAFAYWDVWVDDARLVILNAIDAARRGGRGSDAHGLHLCPARGGSLGRGPAGRSDGEQRDRSKPGQSSIRLGPGSNRSWAMSPA